MAGGQVGEPGHSEVLPQVPELDGRVAADAGVGGAAPDILRDKIIQHLPGEFLLQVQHREGNAQALGQGLHPVLGGAAGETGAGGRPWRSQPWRCSRAAATALSTPPLKAMATLREQDMDQQV